MAVAPDVPPVTVSPVMKALFAEMNSLEFSLWSSARTVAVAPDVAPVIVSFLAKEPAKVISSATTLSPASKPKESVRSNKTKLVDVVWDSKIILSMSVIDSKFNYL